MKLHEGFMVSELERPSIGGEWKPTLQKKKKKTDNKEKETDARFGLSFSTPQESHA